VLKFACLVALTLVAAGCGSSKARPPASPPQPGPGKVIFQGSAWAVVTDGGAASVQHLVGGAWKPAAQGTVKIRVLGPKPASTGNPAIPQVAASLSAGSALVESALWVDGVELLEKGGGLTPKRGTIYGAPASALTRGQHTAIAYARAGAQAAALAWTFSVS
jgi:hypothetical protein